MHSDYHIEDLVYQNENLVVYRVRTADGTPLAIIRLQYEDHILESLEADRFEHALTELKSLSHPCLRPILDGGLDPIDSYPWVAVRWQEGSLLTDRIAQGPLLTQGEFERIKNHGSNLIETLGPVASTISFAPSSVITCGTDPAALIDTFSVDYHAWFHAFATDIHPATLSASYQKLADLLDHLRPYSQHTPATLVTSDLAPSTHRSTLSNPTTSTIALPSATEPAFPLKTILLVSTLLIGASAWFLTQKKTPTPHPIAVISEPPSPQETIQKKSPSKKSQPKKTAPKKSPRPLKPQQKTSRLERPKDFRFKKIDATDPTSIEKNIGEWVKASGNITGLDHQGRITLNRSTLRAAIPSTSQTLAKNAIGNPVTLMGFLESKTLINVPDEDDIEITFSSKETYSVEDEAQLRGIENGKIITLQGEIIAQTESSSGKTLYLQLKAEKPEFAFSIQLSKAETSLTKDYLRSLIDKTLIVKGEIKLDTRGSRLSVIITKKSQITIVE